MRVDARIDSSTGRVGHTDASARKQVRNRHLSHCFPAPPGREAEMASRPEGAPWEVTAGLGGAASALAPQALSALRTRPGTARLVLVSALRVAIRRVGASNADALTAHSFVATGLTCAAAGLTHGAAGGGYAAQALGALRVGGTAGLGEIAARLAGGILQSLAVQAFIAGTVGATDLPLRTAVDAGVVDARRIGNAATIATRLGELSAVVADARRACSQRGATAVPIGNAAAADAAAVRLAGAVSTARLICGTTGHT